MGIIDGKQSPLSATLGLPNDNKISPKIVIDNVSKYYVKAPQLFNIMKNSSTEKSSYIEKPS